MLPLRHAAALGLFALLASATAHAGYRSTRSVSVSSTSASGHVGDTYNSSGTTEMIYCEVRGYATYTHGYCYARAENGATLQCNSMKEPVLRAMMSIHGDSAVSFAIDAYGSCASVIVRNGSTTHPKIPGSTSVSPGVVLP